MSGGGRGPSRSPESAHKDERSKGFHVFLAHNSQDRDLARPVFDALENRGIRCWWQELDAVAGVTSTKGMIEGIDASERFAFLIGPSDVGDWQARFELQQAIERSIKHGKPMFPVLLPGSDRRFVPTEISLETSIELEEGEDIKGGRLTEHGIDKLEAAARGMSFRQFREWRAAAEEGDRAAAAASAAPGRYRALLIGVSRYDNQQLCPLDGPDQDVALLKDALSRVSMPAGAAWSIVTRSNPTFDELKTQLKELFKAPDAENDTVLFYYSGHGVDSYLCATDSQIDPPFKDKALSAQAVAELVKACPVAKKVIVLDCCHAAPLAHSPYASLGDDAAVVLASRGHADASRKPSEPSPFTQALVAVINDPGVYVTAGLTVGRLLRELKRRDVEPWTNRGGRDVVLALGAQQRARAAAVGQPAVTVAVCADQIDERELRLLRQLAITLDGLLAVADDEKQLRGAVVAETTQMLATELRRLAFPAETVQTLAEAQSGAGDEPPTWAVEFVSKADWDALRDLPWEYIGLPDPHEQRENDFTPRVAVEQIFHVPRTKRGGWAAVQQVALFSSRRGGHTGAPDPLFEATRTHLDTFSLKPDPEEFTEWNLFHGRWPEDADVVILQAPVQLRQGSVEVLFAAKDGFKSVPAKSVADNLRRRDAVVLVVIETVADDCRREPARALRRLARYLAVEMKRPVVAACHPRAYLAALDDTPGAPPFAAELLKRHAAGVPLETAAYAARERVATDLGTDTAAIVGLPIVVQPVEVDEHEDARPVPGPGR